MKPLLEDANYDLQNNVSRNVLNQCRLELCNFFKYICYIVAYTRDFLPVKFIFKYFIKKLCFQLSQNAVERESMK